MKDIVFQSQNPTLCSTVLNSASHGDWKILKDISVVFGMSFITLTHPLSSL